MSPFRKTVLAAYSTLYVSHARVQACTVQRTVQCTARWIRDWAHELSCLQVRAQVRRVHSPVADHGRSDFWGAFLLHATDTRAHAMFEPACCDQLAQVPWLGAATQKALLQKKMTAWITVEKKYGTIAQVCVRKQRCEPEQDDIPL